MLRHQAFLFAGYVALLLLPAPARSSGFPTPGTSTSPAFIRVVGSTAGVPDTVAGKFVVTVRDIANNPVPGVFVQVDVSGCPDIRIASDPLNANYVTDCANHTVGAYTNATGVAAMTLLGSSWAAGTHAGYGCARIFAGGELLSTPTVAAFDLDGTAGLTAADLSIWLADLGPHVYCGRSDYDANGVVTASDLSVWLAEQGTHRSATTGAACP